ncbi:CBK_G0011200.mRNA.1.CDS.1 [Saccharomyces cerevisiae]|nr:CBK_G0011200.mRNA.1.CDS.1 [Saccharomyces cerevisiae]CAI7213207.1 CBK_G0011200.mRNA.1.CDS.1 [Saccharomyces cerevisiae]
MDQWLAVIKETIGIKDSTGHNVYSITSRIPTNYGWKRNVKDFWLTSDINAPLWRRILYPPSGSKALLNGIEVDYFKLYKLPNKDVEQGNDMV